MFTLICESFIMSIHGYKYYVCVIILCLFIYFSYLTTAIITYIKCALNSFFFWLVKHTLICAFFFKLELGESWENIKKIPCFLLLISICTIGMKMDVFSSSYQRVRSVVKNGMRSTNGWGTANRLIVIQMIN